MERNAIVNNSGNQTSPRTPLQESPSTFDRRGARAREHQAPPPARFSSLRSDKTVNKKQQPSGNTLLAQRYLLSGNSYFWRTAISDKGGLEQGRARPSVRPVVPRVYRRARSDAPYRRRLSL